MILTGWHAYVHHDQLLLLICISARLTILFLIAGALMVYQAAQRKHVDVLYCGIDCCMTGLVVGMLLRMSMKYS